MRSITNANYTNMYNRTRDAVKWLERSADAREWQALNLAVHPAFASMRKTPEFRALEKRMGLE